MMPFQIVNQEANFSFNPKIVQSVIGSSKNCSISNIISDLKMMVMTRKVALIIISNIIQHNKNFIYICTLYVFAFFWYNVFFAFKFLINAKSNLLNLFLLKANYFWLIINAELDLYNSIIKYYGFKLLYSFPSKKNYYIN
jgi:hypothetical protein